ncbi:hypothetical protein Caci_6656 [Catenulispora acidiphila DSM 44928]|uniref:DUF3592 domain-containing protein n=1 Tax=Catenulispora acidiphila (strain DSM 44928 / JCM 14897 / NBRC 102108 / NRRL B-24433 / ID139908) TaxID=479433 RepID=C7Q009_CATAD|nr:DUF3592 domain-containing protein [Catenulispora acidiphila]ACU75502.1 hypothetical protein Caci_6656 [Catenulispora acidiphila DSM 44928]
MQGISVPIIILGIYIVWKGLVEGLFPALRTVTIRRHGLPAVGTVVANRSRRIDSLQRINAGIYVPRVSYRQQGLVSFTTAEGQRVTFWANLDGWDTPKPEKGTYQLRYLPEDPHAHRFTRPRLVSYWVTAVVGLISGGAFVGLAWFLPQ